MNLPGERRFAERRQRLAREAERRRFQLVTGLAVISTVAVAAIAFFNSAWFDVDEILVEGNVHASSGQIVEASAITAGDGLLTLDVSAAVEGIEGVPWVDRAEVQRDWNGRISISVLERSAVAALPVDDDFVLVDRSGRQLEIVSDAPEGFLPIHGLELKAQAGANVPEEILPLLALLEAFSRHGPNSESDFGSNPVGKQLKAAEVGPEGIALTLVEGNARVLFGDGEKLSEKLQAFTTVLTRVDTACLALLDVRVPAAPVIRRSDSTATSTNSAGSGLDSAAQSGSSGSSDQEVPDSAPADC